VQNVVNIKDAKSLKLQWSTIIGLTAFHAAAIAALFTFSWTNLAVAVVFWWIANSVGIGIGYHRLLTHRGFKTPKWVEYVLTFCGTLALQSGAINWVTTHRLHHAFTETEKDPHSPANGWFQSHMGWMIQGGGQNQSEASMLRYSPDLMRDPVQRFMNKYYWVSSVILALVLLPIGGFSMLFWAIGLRLVFGWHSTWLVNSYTHTWGSRRFDSRDTSTNSPLIAALTFGEGWHNNHHAYPNVAKAGWKWWEIDMTWWAIVLLQRLGLARRVIMPPQR
jgi:stearoyl-CoA desaturase (delta-9 desaturase)